MIGVDTKKHKEKMHPLKKVTVPVDLKHNFYIFTVMDQHLEYVLNKYGF